MEHVAFRDGSLHGICPINLAPLDEEVIDAYLARLIVPRPQQPDLEALLMLMAAHLDRIAYDNVDIHVGRLPANLDCALAAERIANFGRGGYCFTVVGAFAALLTSLGFVVSLHVAGVGPDPPQPEKYGNHVVLLVHLDGEAYIADCGLGEGPRTPFKLTKASWEEDGFTFALEPREGGAWWWRNDPVHGFAGYEVNLATSVASIEEFRGYHEWYWTDPDASYVKAGVIIHRPTASGLLSLHSCTLRRTHPSLPGRYETLRVAADHDEWFALLEEVFHMRLKDLSDLERERLWARVSSDHAAWLEKQRLQT
eukprot:TRINITY_DN37227_c0_g1_i1.p1 TRINITY_DN37227_c0_g1~~TRINITY_DN37227_c0_g1_i1.p1  ORF type:complete len:311 (-),score=43.82 TRINITY_DN37227_c0_g1_i1:247-1179(-)